MFSYPDLSTKLKSKPVIASCKSCLDQLGSLLSVNGLLDGRNSPSSGIVGSFLAAFIVVFHPNTVFETRAEQEDSLYRSADRLLIIFDQVCCTIISQSGQACITISREVLGSYAEALLEYVDLFLVWKNHDKSRLCERIYHSLQAITDALAKLPTSKSEVTVERVQLLTQAKTLRGRLKRIAGADALTSYDAEHPQLVDDIAITSESDFASLFEPMSNEQLAHEVLLDPSFRLQADVDGGDLSTHGVRSVMQIAFWTGVEEDLRRMPPCYGRVLRVLVQVREGVAAVASPSVKTALAELVDENLIRQQAEKGLYGWKECVALISNITIYICDTQVPKRKAETEERWSALKCEMDAADAAAQPGFLCRGLQFLIARANAARADVGNERLMRLASAIQLHGVDYEREKFDAKLRSNALALDQTRAWLRKTLSNRQDKLKNVEGNCATTHRHILAVATAQLAAEYNGTKCPETLLLDSTRLLSLAADFRRLLRAATTLLAARRILAEAGCPVRTIDEAVSAATDSLLRLEAQTDSDIAEAVVAAAVSVAGRGCQDAILNGVQSALAAPAEAVLSVLRQRLLDAWTQAAAGGEEAALSGGSLGNGLEALWPAVLRSARVLGRMAWVNRQVHADRYSAILREEATALLTGKSS